MSALLLRDVEVDGARVDVRVDGGSIAHIAPHGGSAGGAGGARSDDATVVDGDGGALVPGLWDHHIHVVALAAARCSVTVGPPAVLTEGELVTALRRARRPGRWVRAVGYHASVAGEIDRHRLDDAVPDAPVRVQHRSGAMWVFNTPAIELLGLQTEQHAGLERDADGRLTGRAYGADRWLRHLLDRSSPDRDPPDLAAVGRELAGYGVTGLTDATPYDALDDLDLLAAAVAAGDLPQRVVAMGGPALASATLPSPLGEGPVKLLLADHSLPALDDLEGWITAAHRAGRPVAAHCVTRTSLVLFLAALDAAGGRDGDRVEHGSVVPPELRDAVADRGLSVVTQPNFVVERGDHYLAEVEAHDRPHLYPCRSLLDAGVAVGGSTDAPFGHPDPWRAIAAAIDRRTADGAVVGADERITSRRALELFLGSPSAPGGPPRRLAPGAPADLCLLDAPLATALATPSADRVRATVIGGDVVT